MSRVTVFGHHRLRVVRTNPLKMFLERLPISSTNLQTSGVTLHAGGALAHAQLRWVIVGSSSLLICIAACSNFGAGEI